MTQTKSLEYGTGALKPCARLMLTWTNRRRWVRHIGRTASTTLDWGSRESMVSTERPQGGILRALLAEERRPICDIEVLESRCEMAHKCVEFGGRDAISFTKEG